MAWEAQAEVPGGFAEEADLVAGLRTGRRDAFEALHAAYAARIYNLALRIVDDPEEAQDVAQEVLLTVFRSLPGNETDLNLPAWLYRVTVNKAFDHIRARKRRPVTVVDEAAPEAQSAVDEYERAELSRRVECTLRELPKRQQLALVLRDVNGLSVGETASVLGLTRGSADVLLSRARAGFRRVFLSGAGSLTGRCDRADKALAAGVGRGERVPPSLLEHSKTCPDCRRAVEVWGAAPIGLGLLLSQVALPAKLSLGATLAAAQAAGIAVPVGLGAAGAAAASSSAAAGASAAGVSAASAASVVGSAAGVTAGSAGGAGLLAALGSAAGVKIATLAVAATAAVGVAGVATQRAHTLAGTPAPAQPWTAGVAGQGVSAGADGSGQVPDERVRQMRRAHASAGAGQTSAGADDRQGSRATDARGAGSSTGAARRTGKAGRAGGSPVGASAGVAAGGSGGASGAGGSGAVSGADSTSGSGGGSGKAGDGSGSGEGGGQSGDTGSGSAGGMLSPE